MSSTTMGGPELDHPDPRMRGRANQQAPKTDSHKPDPKQPLFTIRTNEPTTGELIKGGPGHTASLMAISATAYTEAPSDVNSDYASTGHGDNDDFKTYIASLNADNARLTKEKADAIQQCADIQKEHAKTVTKYKDAHARFTNLNQIRINLDASIAKRIQEKDEAVQQNETLTTQNAELLQTCAKLVQENAKLKEENTALLQVVEPLQTAVNHLQAGLASLTGSKEYNEIKQKQYNAVKTERDNLRKQIEAQNQSQLRKNDRNRGRSRSRSRSPPRDYTEDRWLPTHHRDRYDPRDRGRSRARSAYRRRDNSDLYELNPSHPHAPIRRREPSRLLTPRETPETTMTANAKGTPALDFPNLVKKKNTSKDSEPSSVPTAPKLGSIFSMRDINNKLPPKAPKGQKGAKTTNGYRGH